jgi:hypothetical protein
MKERRKGKEGRKKQTKEGRKEGRKKQRKEERKLSYPLVSFISWRCISFWGAFAI